jgi:DNA end-binding protein Ku
VPIGAAELKEPELKLAVHLIAQATTEEFHPEAYQDSQRKRMRELIDRKIQGEEIAVTPEEAPKGEIIDLMAALKASLKAAPKPQVDVAAMAEEQPVSIANRRPPKKAALTSAPATGKSKPKKRA